MKVIWLRNFGDQHKEQVFVLVQNGDHYLAQLSYLEYKTETVKSMEHCISESTLQDQLRCGNWIIVKEIYTKV